MRFAQPSLLYFLWLLPFVILIFILIARRRWKIMGNFVAVSLLDEMTLRFSRRRRLIKNILLIGALVFAIIALARPQWGYQWQQVKREGLDVLLVIDTSRSMLTQDVKPNRLERTKLAVKDLVKQLKGDRIGLVAFAGDAFLMCPLTVDYSGFLLSLNDLDTNIVSRGGTNLGQAINEAIKGYDKIPTRYKAVVIVTDGDDLEGDSIDAARQAKEQGIKLYCLGVGTRDGDLIEVTNDQGQKEYLKGPEGNFVKSRLNEELLKKIAATTGGAYVRSSGAEFGLDYLYREHLSQLEKREINDKVQQRFYERYQWPLAICGILLLLESIINTGSSEPRAYRRSR